MAKLSVLIPTFNRMNLLRDCLVTLIQQTFTDFRVLIYDDGSDDDTQMQLYHAQKQDSRLCYSRSQDNHGVGYARNYLLQMALDGGTEFAAWHDSDDLSNIYRFMSQISVMQERLSGIMVSTNHVRLTSRNRHEIYERPLIVMEDRGWSLGSTMFRVREAVQFNPSVTLGGEDTDWKLAMSLSGVERINMNSRLYYIRMDNRDRIGRQKVRDKAGKARSDAARTKTYNSTHIQESC